MTDEQPDETATAGPRPTPVAGRPPTVSTGPDDPFAEDLLDRRETAHMLSQLLERTPGPFVLALDAPWGMGKTTFLEMWRASLSQEGFACLSINALNHAGFAGGSIS